MQLGLRWAHCALGHLLFLYGKSNLTIHIDPFIDAMNGRSLSSLIDFLKIFQTAGFINKSFIASHLAGDGSAQYA